MRGSLVGGSQLSCKKYGRYTPSLPPVSNLSLRATTGMPIMGCSLLPPCHPLDIVSGPRTRYCGLPPTAWLAALPKRVPPSRGHVLGLHVGSGRNNALLLFMSEGA